jgi:hypothetical protein
MFLPIIVVCWIDTQPNHETCLPIAAGVFSPTEQHCINEIYKVFNDTNFNKGLKDTNMFEISAARCIDINGSTKNTL